MGFMRGEGGSGGGGGGVPTLTASRAVVTNGSGALAAADVTAAELAHLDGVTSGIQGQLDGKQPLDALLTAIAALVTAADKLIYTTGSDTVALADLTAAGRTLLAAADAAAQRTALGLGTAAVEAATAFTSLAPATSARNEIVPTANDALAQRHKQKSGGQTTLYELQRSDGTKAVTLATTGIYFWNAAGTSVVGKIDNRGVDGWGSVWVDNGIVNGMSGSREWNGANFSIVAGDLIRWAAAAFGAYDTAIGRSAAGVVEVNNGTAGQYRDLALRNLVVAEGGALSAGTTTGAKIGTSVSQKLGFYGATPVVQPADNNQSEIGVLEVSGSGADADINTNFQAVFTLVNQLRTDLVALGLIKGSA